MQMNKTTLLTIFAALLVPLAAGALLLTGSPASSHQHLEKDHSGDKHMEKGQDGKMAADENPLTEIEATPVKTGDWGEGVGLEVGDTAPDFYYYTVDGEKGRLSDLRGKRVMLNFWATWCPKCDKELPDMAELHKEKAEEWNFEIVGIAHAESSSVEKVNEEIEQRGMAYPIAFDADMDLWNAYKAEATPTTLFLNEDGEITEKLTRPLNKEELMARLKPGDSDEMHSGAMDSEGKMEKSEDHDSGY